MAAVPSATRVAFATAQLLAALPDTRDGGVQVVARVAPLGGAYVPRHGAVVPVDGGAAMGARAVVRPGTAPAGIACSGRRTGHCGVSGSGSGASTAAVSWLMSMQPSA
jgi:hypothetical protein